MRHEKQHNLLVFEESKGVSERSLSSLFTLPVKNENGAVLVLSVIILALMTCLGIAAMNTTTLEYKMAGNEKSYKTAFYEADAGISYAVQAGLALFPPAAPGSWTALPVVPGELTTRNVQLEYMDNGGAPRRVEIRSTGTAPGGGQAVIRAGIYGVTTGLQAGSSNPLSYSG